MRILICNDDGIFFPGIVALAKAFVALGEVYLVAPDVERSAASNALTLSNILRVKEVDINIPGVKAFTTSGTPADCAKMGIETLLPARPDLIVSGINKGQNMCVDIMYSGTCAAGYEGAFVDILSMSVSLDHPTPDADYSIAAEWALKTARKLIEIKADPKYLYNLNVPNLPKEQIKGLKVTKVGRVIYTGGFEKRIDTYGRPYYWVNGRPQVADADPECDNNSVAEGYVSLSPLTRDLTAYEQLETLKNAF